MNRFSIAAAVAALVFAMPDAYAQATSGTPAAPGHSGANATATGSTPTGAVVPGPTATDRSTAGAPATSNLDRGDRRFLEKAAQGGMKEVEFGRLAAGKASDASVKAFAERMVKDHGDANKKLMDLAQSKGVTPRATLRPQDRHELKNLEQLEPAKFDQAYMKDMVDDHMKDVKSFEKEAKSAKDPDVKRFAADTLPVLQEHLRMAEETNAKLPGSTKAKEKGAKKQ